MEKEKLFLVPQGALQDAVNLLVAAKHTDFSFTIVSKVIEVLTQCQPQPEIETPKTEGAAEPTTIQ